MTGKRREVLSKEGGANKIIDKPIPNGAIQPSSTELNPVEPSEINANSVESSSTTNKRSYFGVKLTKEELDYLEKLKRRHNLSGGSAFHLILSEYMRNHTL